MPGWNSIFDSDKTFSGAKIGYVPKQDKVILARLRDAGKLLFGRVASKEKKALGYKTSKI